MSRKGMHRHKLEETNLAKSLSRQEIKVTHL